MRPKQEARPNPIVGAAQSYNHTPQSMTAAIRSVIENMEPRLDAIIRPGDNVLIKVNMGCTGVRPPDRLTSAHTPE